jgi:5-methylcytosine-specific restriction enzyme A
MREAWKHFYDTAFWQRRRKLQLTAHPLCAMCAARGVVTPATVADHLVPHKGNWNLFATGELQSLCDSCHNSRKRYVEVRGYSVDVGYDGWPIDPKHPANRTR